MHISIIFLSFLPPPTLGVLYIYKRHLPIYSTTPFCTYVQKGYQITLLSIPPSVRLYSRQPIKFRFPS